MLDLTKAPEQPGMYALPDLAKIADDNGVLCISMGYISTSPLPFTAYVQWYVNGVRICEMAQSNTLSDAIEKVLLQKRDTDEMSAYRRSLRLAQHHADIAAISGDAA